LTYSCLLLSRSIFISLFVSTITILYPLIFNYSDLNSMISVSRSLRQSSSSIWAEKGNRQSQKERDQFKNRQIDAMSSTVWSPNRWGCRERIYTAGQSPAKNPRTRIDGEWCGTWVCSRRWICNTPDAVEYCQMPQLMKDRFYARDHNENSATNW
jgi:hypothetical protein